MLQHIIYGHKARAQDWLWGSEIFGWSTGIFVIGLNSQVVMPTEDTFTGEEGYIRFNIQGSWGSLLERCQDPDEVHWALGYPVQSRKDSSGPYELMPVSVIVGDMGNMTADLISADYNQISTKDTTWFKMQYWLTGSEMW